MDTSGIVSFSTHNIGFDIHIHVQLLTACIWLAIREKGLSDICVNCQPKVPFRVLQAILKSRYSFLVRALQQAEKSIISDEIPYQNVYELVCVCGGGGRGFEGELLFRSSSTIFSGLFPGSFELVNG